MSTKFFVLLLCTVVCSLAQSQAALRQAFEGKTVRVKTEMPATNDFKFHLCGGGYGTFGDDTGNVSPGTASKGRPESDLERDLQNETDPRRRVDRKEAGYRGEAPARGLSLQHPFSERVFDGERTSSAGRPRDPDEVYRILGERSNKDRSSFGAFEQITATWVPNGNLKRVVVINEVAVKITVESR